MTTTENSNYHGQLTFEFPKNLTHPIVHTNMIAAYLLEYWATKGVIPHYTGVIDGLREGADEIFKIAIPVSNNTSETLVK